MLCQWPVPSIVIFKQKHENQRRIQMTKNKNRNKTKEREKKLFVFLQNAIPLVEAHRYTIIIVIVIGITGTQDNISLNRRFISHNCVCPTHTHIGTSKSIFSFMGRGTAEKSILRKKKNSTKTVQTSGSELAVVVVCD